MSVEAITWALKQDAGMSSAKFVLVVMANCANGDDFVCRPSIAYLSSATGQNRKTVIANIQRLLDRNLIADTGKRAGATGQIHIYSMNVNSTKTGTVKESQKRNSSENGTVPKTDAKSPKNGRKESQKRDTETKEKRKETKEGGTTSRIVFKTPKTFLAYLDECEDCGVRPIPGDDAVFDYAQKVGLPEEFLRLCWLEFMEKYKLRNKRYKDWRLVFLNCVKDNWFGLWALDPGTNDYYLTRGKGLIVSKKHEGVAA